MRPSVRRAAERLLKYWRINFQAGIGNAHHVLDDQRDFEEWLEGQLCKNQPRGVGGR